MRLVGSTFPAESRRRTRRRHHAGHFLERAPCGSPAWCRPRPSARSSGAVVTRIYPRLARSVVGAPPVARAAAARRRRWRAAPGHAAAGTPRARPGPGFCAATAPAAGCARPVRGGSAAGRGRNGTRTPRRRRGRRARRRLRQRDGPGRARQRDVRDGIRIEREAERREAVADRDGQGRERASVPPRPKPGTRGRATPGNPPTASSRNANGACRAAAALVERTRPPRARLRPRRGTPR